MNIGETKEVKEKTKKMKTHKHSAMRRSSTQEEIFQRLSHDERKEMSF